MSRIAPTGLGRRRVEGGVGRPSRASSVPNRRDHIQVVIANVTSCGAILEHIGAMPDVHLHMVQEHHGDADRVVKLRHDIKNFTTNLVVLKLWLLVEVDHLEGLLFAGRRIWGWLTFLKL